MDHAETVIIVDLEGTCCDDDSIPPEERETIEIGAVELACRSVTREFQGFVRPVRHPVLTAFCQTLTGITQEQVSGAESFPGVWMEFRAWCRGHEFHSWGTYDLEQFQRDCDHHGVVMDMQHRNLAQMYRQKFGGRKCGHRRAMKRLGIEPTGAHHRGLDDARNIALLAVRILREES